MRNATKGMGMLAAALVFVASIDAAADTRSNSVQRNFGNSDAGSYVFASGSMSNTRSSSDARATVGAGVRLFGRSIEAVRAEARSGNQYGSGSTTLSLFVCGTRVYSNSPRTSWSRSWSYSQTFLSANATFIVGPGIPVNVWGSVGGGLNGSVQLSIAATGCGVNGSANAYAYGQGGAGFGVPGFRVGVQVTLNLFDTTLTAGMNANFSSISGYVRLQINPVRIYVEIGLFSSLGNLTRRIVDYSYPSTSITLF